MLEAKTLAITPIDDLDAYYCQRMSGYTTLSLHVDGATVYALDVRGVVRPHSGKGTVGAFTSSDKCTLVAWIDPVSGKFISTDPTVPDALFSIPISIAIGVVFSAALHVNKWVIAPIPPHSRNHLCATACETPVIQAATVLKPLEAVRRSMRCPAPSTSHLRLSAPEHQTRNT